MVTSPLQKARTTERLEYSWPLPGNDTRKFCVNRHGQYCGLAHMRYLHPIYPPNFWLEIFSNGATVAAFEYIVGIRCRNTSTAHANKANTAVSAHHTSYFVRCKLCKARQRLVEKYYLALSPLMTIPMIMCFE